MEPRNKHPKTKLKFYSQPIPNQHYSHPIPNPQTPRTQYYSQPIPNQHYTHPTSPICYSPSPPSPHFQSSHPIPLNPKYYHMATTGEFNAFEGFDEDEDVVDETQPSPHEIPLPEDEEDDVQEVDVCVKKAFATRKAREQWTDEQEVALAQAWIQISECKQFGNEQKADGFWKRVLTHYAKTVGGSERTFHSLHTKWKVMNTAMGSFNGLHIQAVRAKGSGCNDLDVMKVAMTDYHTKHKKQFTHVPAWGVVKSHDKWLGQECFQEIPGMKRASTSINPATKAPSTSNTSSSKRKSVELDSASVTNVIPDMNEDPNPKPFKSPKKSKKKQPASSSTGTTAGDISAYTQRKSKYLDSKEEKDELAKRLMATQLEGEKFKNKQREMKFFLEPHDHIEDPNSLEILLAEKREIAAKYGWTCHF